MRKRRSPGVKKGQGNKVGAGRLVLASASPRRAALLAEAGYTFDVVISPVEEPARRPGSIPLERWPTALAYIKARSVQLQIGGAATIIGADTIVVLDGAILGKPRDRAHARRMLQRLSGTEHQVITGLAILRGTQCRLSRAVSTCRIRRLSPAFLRQYLDSGLWKGKAGAYGIQDHDDPWVSLVDGEWSNVVGLPMKLLAREMEQSALAAGD